MPSGSPGNGLGLLTSIVTGLSSVACLVAGGIYIGLGFQHQRETLTVDFKGAEDDWPKARKEFEGLQVTAILSDTLVTLAPNDTVDHWNDVQGFVPDYSPLVYRYIGRPNNESLLAELSEMKLQARSSPAQKREAVGAAASVTWRVNGSVLLTQAFPLVRATERREAGPRHGRCAARTGFKVNGGCWAFSRLSRLCIQVAAPANGSGEWSVARQDPARNDSLGCDFASGTWAIAQYRPLYLPKTPDWGGDWPRGAIRFSDLVLEVRSNMDPYFSGVDLTRGTMNFGMSAQQDDVVGIMLLLLGVALSLPLICAVITRRAKRSWPGPARRYATSGRWTGRRPDPEVIGMRYAVDAAAGHVAAARGLEQAIDRAVYAQEDLSN
uniref:Uncharacterized protein n=1 Tax=Alexandrium monilatum TaxID=311494 RepID=A0A7S4Q5A1_9DINO|mmetsp:Transcript_106593/g.339419  ORF Transcript_106593/g.339419 Transcript_106593/m.339419 type:complete len:381 (-) Transcript_106593:34-1176(-)